MRGSQRVVFDTLCQGIEDTASGWEHRRVKKKYQTWVTATLNDFYCIVFPSLITSWTLIILTQFSKFIIIQTKLNYTCLFDLKYHAGISLLTQLTTSLRGRRLIHKPPRDCSLARSASLQCPSSSHRLNLLTSSLLPSQFRIFDDLIYSKSSSYPLVRYWSLAFTLQFHPLAKLIKFAANKRKSPLFRNRETNCTHAGTDVGFGSIATWLIG